MTNREVGTLPLAEEISVVSPSRISEVDVPMVEGSSIAVAVAKTGTSIEEVALS